MVMPFSNKVADDNYKHSIKIICEEFDLEVRRSDEIFGTRPIYEDIVHEIQNSSVVIVDITDKNPNVFYELGISHTLKQNRTIVVTQDDFGNMPFDIAHFSIIVYKNSIGGKVEFEDTFRSTLCILFENKLEYYKEEFNLI